MTLIAEVTDQGILRVKSPDLKPGDEVIIETIMDVAVDSGKGKWSEIKKALAKANSLDFPRRTHEEILRDLHELRG